MSRTLSLLILLLAIHPATAQTATQRPRGYVRFDFDGNPERALEQFLRSQDPELVRQFLRQNQDWQKLLDGNPVDLHQKLQQFQDNPLFKGLVDKFLQGDGKFGEDDPEFLKKWQKFGEQIMRGVDGSDKILKDAMESLPPDNLDQIKQEILKIEPMSLTPPDKEVAPIPNLNELAPADLDWNEQIARAMNDWLKDEGNQEWLAGILRDSPELQNAVGDLAKSLSESLGEGGNWMPKLPDTPKLPFDWKPPKLPDFGPLPKLTLPRMPELPKVNVPLPTFGGNWTLPRMPNFGGGPRMPSAPGIPSEGSGWITFGVLVMAIIVGTLVLKNMSWARAKTAAQRRWQASFPREITTRTDLRRAFDSLALGKFGELARPWNHRLVAHRLSKEPAHQPAAQSIAQLYEEAPYAPGDDSPLPMETRAQAEAYLAELREGVT